MSITEFSGWNWKFFVCVETNGQQQLPSQSLPTPDNQVLVRPGGNKVCVCVYMLLSVLDIHQFETTLGQMLRDIQRLMVEKIKETLNSYMIEKYVFEKGHKGNTSYLGISGSGGSITFSVIHDSTIRANYTLHCSHLVAWPTWGSALSSQREKKEKWRTMNYTIQIKKCCKKKCRKNRLFIWDCRGKSIYYWNQKNLHGLTLIVSQFTYTRNFAYRDCTGLFPL